ncbi:MAG: HAMP domain-containing protein [Oceanospirillaceae bacterium]|nr:HAMP domain-containing protein [Oceanospirillaceae bacterium]MCP5335608.1 HAMP domain-containing protein [Oceanospirillaceae bacterium]
MSFRTRIFLVMLLVSVVLAFALLFFFRSSVETGFWRYVQAREIRAAQPVLSALAAEYAAADGWQNIADTENHWQAFLRKHAQHLQDGPGDKTGPDFGNTPGPGGQGDMQGGPPDKPDGPPGKQGGPDGFNGDKFNPGNFKPDAGGPPGGFDKPANLPLKPYALFDANRILLRGRNWFSKDMTLLAVEINGNTVGYLGLPTRPDIRDFQGQGFIENQLQHLLIITLVGLVLAALVALALSALLVKRIEALVAQVRAYSMGRYDAKLTLQGRDELQILSRHLNDLGDSLRQGEQTRKQWVADISHELRTPLAVLQADLEALEDGVRVLDDAAVQRLQKQVLRLNRLVEDLYDLSLADVGALSYRKTRCDVQELCADCAALLQTPFANAGLQFTFNSIAGPVYVLGDAQRITQLLMNLLNNALKYTHAPGAVQLELNRQGNAVIITLDDSAPGVPQHLREKLFERFYRTEASRNRDSGGAGLGLSLCRHIVQAHQGEITLHTSPLGGLRVSVRLPAE